MSELKNLSQLVASSERLGAIGSPSGTTELTIDIFGAAAGRRLVGELGVFCYYQDGIEHYALGQITEVLLRNPTLEQSVGRSIIRERGQWSTVQGQLDTHTATVHLGAVFSVSSGTVKPSMLGTVPPTGTIIYCATEELLAALLAPYQNEVFYLGHIYGSRPRLPMWFKHFGSGPGGAGEAYSIGVFGKTGSGKSVLAKMILVAYARHAGMGLFVLDPQGEFTKGLKFATLASTLSMGNILSKPVFSALGRKAFALNIDSLVLDRWDLWKEVLVQLNFFEDIGIKWPEYQSNMADYVEDFLARKKKKLGDLNDERVLREVLGFVAENVDKVYAGKAGIERVSQLAIQALDEPDSTIGQSVRKKWFQVAKLFQERSGAYSVQKVVAAALRPPLEGSSRPLVVVDLSAHPEDIEPSLWDEKIKPLLIERFLRAVVEQGEWSYRNGQYLNALVVIDEAHRLVPRERVENERWARIKGILVDAVRTTRKYSLGWLFISQTLSSLDKDVVGQLRIMFFGFGLGTGVELQALRELVGGEREYLRLYQSFRDPQSAFGEENKVFSFMAIGPVSPLAFSGTPLFFDAFTRADEFLAANSIRLETS